MARIISNEILKNIGQKSEMQEAKFSENNKIIKKSKTDNTSIYTEQETKDALISYAKANNVTLSNLI